MARQNVTTTGSTAVDAFAQAIRNLPAAGHAGSRGRLIFAMDATASREPAWARARDVQAQMFEEAERLGGLDVQLVYYRGLSECRASRWVGAPAELVRLMERVACVAGRTQIVRVLRHALNETGKERVHAVVFVGDACEEAVDELGELAGRLGLLGVRMFLFHEGSDPVAERAFGQLARLTGGAVCRFDAAAPAQLRALLAAVAVYATGGVKALRDHARTGPAEVRLIERQVR